MFTPLVPGVMEATVKSVGLRSPYDRDEWSISQSQYPPSLRYLAISWTNKKLEWYSTDTKGIYYNSCEMLMSFTKCSAFFLGLPWVFFPNRQVIESIPWTPGVGQYGAKEEMTQRWWRMFPRCCRRYAALEAIESSLKISRISRNGRSSVFGTPRFPVL